MDKPSFKLDIFEGPLDLLLHLISKNKVSIYDIPIAEILKQYMEYMDSARRLNLELTGDFSVMAAHLVYIKSKMLLPSDDDEHGEDPRDSLVEMLEEYQKMKNASVFFEKREDLFKDIFTKQAEPLEPSHEYSYKHTVEQLVSALSGIKERDGRKLPPPIGAFSGILNKKIASVSNKTDRILALLSQKYCVKFSELLAESQSRSELIACFLAVLELLKDTKIELSEQDGDYMISAAGFSVVIAPDLTARAADTANKK